MATFEVTNKEDSGEGSLRDAIEQANAAPGADEIVFSGDALVTSQSPDPIVLTSAPLRVIDSVTIRGPSRDSVVIDGNDATLLIAAGSEEDGDPPELVLEGITLQNGRNEGFGGCLVSTDAIVTVRASTIRDCVAESMGGGIAAGGSVLIEDSLITGNEASMGGGVMAGELTVRRSVVSGNTAQEGAGGLILYAYSGAQLLIEESTIVGNSAPVGAGVTVAAFADDGTPTIRSSTISGNTAANTGGGVFVYYGPALLIENSTISGNSAPSGAGVAVGGMEGTTTIRNSTIVHNDGSVGSAGLAVRTGDLVVESSILSGNTITTDEDEHDDDITFVSTEGTLTVTASLVGATGNGVDAQALQEAGNLVGVDPQLGPLADNGGLTQTHLPLDGSPVIDAGSNGAKLDFDQRGDGFARQQGGGVDIGAVEVAPAAVTLSLDGSPVDEGGTATVTATISRTSNLDVTIELGFTGTATKGDDYTPSAETITIAAGQTTGSITLAVVDDEEEEGEETIVVAISGVTNAVEVNPQQVTATITASDQPAPSPSPAPGGGSGNGDGCGCSSGGDAATALALGAVMLWGVVSRRLARG